MATQFTNVQTQGLEAASKRIAEGSANQTDINNVNYAKSKGWTPLANYMDKNAGTIDTNKLSETKIDSAQLGGGYDPMKSFADTLMSAGTDSINRYIADTLNEQQRIAQEQKDAEQKRYDEAMAGVTSSMEARTKLSQELQSNRVNLESKLGELRSIQEQLAYQDTKYKNEIALEESKPILASAIDGNKVLISKQYAAQVSGLQARAAIAKDNIALASSIFDDYYTKANQLNEQQINTYNSLLELSNNKILNLDKNEKDVINNKLNALQNEKQDVQKIQQMFMQNPALYLQAGIRPDMNMEQISNLLATNKESASLISNQSAVADLASKYPDAGIVSTDTLAQAQMKLAKSAIYRNDTYIASSSGGGSTGNATIPTTPDTLQAFLSQDTSSGKFFANTELINNTYPSNQRASMIISANAEANRLNAELPNKAIQQQQQTTKKPEFKRSQAKDFGAIGVSYGGKNYLPSAIADMITAPFEATAGKLGTKVSELIWGK